MPGKDIAMDTPTSFGYWVRRRRKALDLTQNALARRVGCAVITIQKIEADERRPSSQIAELLAEHLRIPPDEWATFLQRARGELATDLPPAVTVQEAQSPAAVASHHNLPAQLTSFVGRSRELATTATMLTSAHLLTLTGPGGTGKTRLALRLAEGVLDQFPASVWLVELAPLADPALIVPTIATVLGVREESGRALLATLTAYLREKQLLLVLDNCEHLIDACAQLAETLLRACPRLRILASSREPLGIAGEAFFRVPALLTPDPRQLPPLDQLAQYEAVQLFVARAAAVQPAFELTAATAAPLAQICARLDGIPLAIELAAARTRMLTIEQIAARLDDRFRLLTGGSRTALPRHQTLQALVDWSYDLLTDAERTLLLRLAVFANGWTLEAAEAVCEFRIENEALRKAEDDHVVLSSQFSILDLLGHLVDKSLVQVDQAGHAARYRMLDTIRQYALEKLTASGEADRVRRRHAQYYLELAERAENLRPDVNWVARAARLETEHDNLRAALAWSQATAGDARIGLRLAKELLYLWMTRGHWTEARSWLTRVLAHLEGAERTLLRAQVLTSAGWMFALLCDYVAAQAAFAESLAICEDLGDTHERAWVLNRLGWLAREQGDATLARARLKESLELYRELGDSDGIIEGLNTLGEVAVIQEDPARATTLLEESLALAQSMGDAFGTAWALNHLGHVAQLEHEYGRAMRLHMQSLSLFRAFGEQHPGIPWAFQGLGESALAQGDLAGAQERLAAALTQFHNLGDRAGISWCLASLGSAAALDQQPERAARLWGAAERLRAALGSRRAPAARATYDRAVALARTEIGEDAFAAAWAAGQALPLDSAIAEALVRTEQMPRDD
jgi:non-specific serine/threonine protein kinase